MPREAAVVADARLACNWNQVVINIRNRRLEAMTLVKAFTVGFLFFRKVHPDFL